MDEPLKLSDRTAAQVSEHLDKELEEIFAQPDEEWKVQPGAPGHGLVRLFGRLVELFITRLNRLPEKHMRAFLHEAGIDLLPPLGASTEVAFAYTATLDGAASIRVPERTQLVTEPSADGATIVFETLETINVVPARLARTVVVDQTRWSDHTAKATGMDMASFAAFQGTEPRVHRLFIGDPLFSLSDFSFATTQSRKSAKVTVTFEFADALSQSDANWQLRWRCCPAMNEPSADGEVTDDTEVEETDEELSPSFADGSLDWPALGDQDVAVSDHWVDQRWQVTFVGLPNLTELELQGQADFWLAADLLEGDLPAIGAITIKREIEISAPTALAVVPPEAAPGAMDLLKAGQWIHIPAPFTVTAIQGGSAYLPIDAEGEFPPFGPVPVRLDTFYLTIDEAFSKPGVSVLINLEVQPFPDEIRDDETLKQVRVVWEYYATIRDADGEQIFENEAWRPLGSSTLAGFTPDEAGFIDTTHAFTRSGYVAFAVPSLTATSTFAPTVVNEVVGLWVRARIDSGRYEVPGSTVGIVASWFSKRRRWYQPEALPPLVRRMEIYYSGYHEAAVENRPIAHCLGLSDNVWHDLVAGWHLDQAARPFGLHQRLPALYLGFEPETEEEKGIVPFPPDVWACLHLDVEEDAAATYTLATGMSGAMAALEWEYWNGEQWRLFRFTDATHGLTRRGNLGFYGQSDHLPSPDFGTAAYWIRARSTALDVPSARLRRVTPNMVAVHNAETFDDEVIGSGNGEARQRFDLAQRPVHLDTEIIVLENDRPGQLSFAQHDHSLDESEEAEPELVGDYVPGVGVWVLWRRVTSFNDSGPESRHYLLDANDGFVRFGDGEYGKIPPIGIDNIKALRYRRQDADLSNVPPSTITTLRNTPGELGEIQRVTNIEAAVGGSSAEAIDAVKRRGPKTLRHRNRAVTIEDYEWIAEEVPGIAHIYCLPTTDYLGRRAPGHVTLIVVPKVLSRFGFAPTPALLRSVRHYVEARALTNLAESEQPSSVRSNGLTRPADLVSAQIDGETIWFSIQEIGEQPLAVWHNVAPLLLDHSPTNAALRSEIAGQVAHRVRTARSGKMAADDGTITAAAVDASQIFVKGPDYIQVAVHADIVPIHPEDATDVKLAVLKRLDEFLHPIHGGPDRQGWEPGRNVYVSEVYEQLENVPGVDHAGNVLLVPAIQQQRLILRPDPDMGIGAPPVPHPTPERMERRPTIAVGGRVYTMFGHIEQEVATPLSLSHPLDELSVVVQGFKIGDQILVTGMPGPAEARYVSAIDGDWLTFDRPIRVHEAAAAVNMAVIDEERTVRWPITQVEPVSEEHGIGASVFVRRLKAGDPIALVEQSGALLWPHGEIASVSNRWVEFATPFAPPAAWAAFETVLLADGGLARSAVRRTRTDASGLVTAVEITDLLLGDDVTLVGNGDLPVSPALTILDTDGDRVTFMQSLPGFDAATRPQLALRTLDARVTAPVVDSRKEQVGGTLAISAVQVARFRAEDRLALANHGSVTPEVEWLRVVNSEDLVGPLPLANEWQQVFVPDGNLVLPGPHQIRITRS